MYNKFGQFINGKWLKSSSGETYEVFNPANEETIGKPQKPTKKILIKLFNQRKKVLKSGKILHHGKDQKL